jgi:hypothetical protein
MTWDKSAGTVSVYLRKDLIKDTPYTFSFTLINGQITFEGHSDITVEVPHISDTTHTLSGTVMEVVGATMTASATQSTSQPCAENVITVSLQATFPIRKLCNPALTIVGLTGSSSLGASVSWSNGEWPDYSISIQDDAAAGFATTAAWGQSDGVLIVLLEKDLSGATHYAFTVTLQNGATAHDPGPLLLSSQAVYTTITISSLSGQAAPLTIDALEFDTKSMGQSSFYACAENLITGDRTLSTSSLL